MINLFDSKCTNFSNNGLVVLSDAISCTISEELNGLYELELEYPIDTRGKWKYLLEENIIKADGQLFRIYRKVKVLNSIKINARHVFYDLLDNFLEDVRPTNLSGSGALDWILTHTQYPHNYINMSDVGGYDTRYFVRKNPVEAIMGEDGIIATWGGELVRDNYIIKLLEARGLDRGVLIAYGKNIQGIEETLNTDSMCTRLMPLGRDALMIPEKYIDSQYISNYSHPKIKLQDFDIGVDEELGITEEMAIVRLRAAGTKYMLNGKIDIPAFNYKIDFLELSKTEEYKNYAVLERVYLGDTVTVRHSRLNLDLKAKVIKITKNVLTGRIEKVELGSFKPNIASGIDNAIQDVRQEIVKGKSEWQKAVGRATDLLTSALGGFVIKRAGELLIMDTEDELTATKVWRWNLNGLGYSSTGINGPYALAMTMDGQIVASFISGLLGEFVIVRGEQVEGTLGLFAKIRANQIILGPEGETIPNDLVDTSAIESVANQAQSTANTANSKATQAQTNAINALIAASSALQPNASYNNTYISQNGIQVKNASNGVVVNMGNFASGLYGIRASHTDGSYTQLTAAGLERLVAGESKPYHYDTYILSASTKGIGVSFVERDWSDAEQAAATAVWQTGIYVYLPTRFRDKDFQCFLSMVATDIPIYASSGCYVTLKINAISKPLARIHVIAYNTAYLSGSGGGWPYGGIDFLVTAVL